MSWDNNFYFCPKCGKKNIALVDGKKWRCADCGFDLYHSVAAAVNVIIADADGNVLFEKRAKEPRRGFLALPGGFVNPDEGAEDAAMRECREETGLAVSRVAYFTSLPNAYEYKNILYKTCDVFYEAKLPADVASVDELIKRLHAEKSEVQSFVSARIADENALSALPLAFENARKALSMWMRRNRS